MNKLPSLDFTRYVCEGTVTKCALRWHSSSLVVCSVQRYSLPDKRFSLSLSLPFAKIEKKVDVDCLWCAWLQWPSCVNPPPLAHVLCEEAGYSRCTTLTAFTLHIEVTWDSATRWGLSNRPFPWIIPSEKLEIFSGPLQLDQHPWMFTSTLMQGWSIAEGALSYAPCCHYAKFNG